MASAVRPSAPFACTDEYGEYVQVLESLAGGEEPQAGRPVRADLVALLSSLLGIRKSIADPRLGDDIARP